MEKREALAVNDPLGTSVASIASIDPSAKSPLRGTIRVGKKPVATLPFTVIASLGIKAGQSWTIELQSQVREAVRYDEAFSDAMNKIDKRAYSESELMEKLIGAGHDESLARAIVARLVELGALNDRALGEALIDEAKLRGPVAGARHREKLLKRGLPESLVDELSPESEGHSGPEATRDALLFARKKLGTMMRLDRDTQRRRLWGLLARRGFEESLVESVIEKLLGIEE